MDKNHSIRLLELTLQKYDSTCFGIQGLILHCLGKKNFFMYVFY